MDQVKMQSGIVHHKSDRKSCVLPTADRNTMHENVIFIFEHFSSFLYIPKEMFLLYGTPEHEN